MSDAPTITRRTAVCTGKPVDMHIASSAKSSVVRTLSSYENFDIDHDTGTPPDRWFAIRTRRGETGYIPADAPIRITAQIVAAPPPVASTSAADAIEQREKAIRDILIGIAFVALGLIVLWSFNQSGSWPSTGVGKEWIAVGYGGFRCGRGILNLL